MKLAQRIGCSARDGCACFRLDLDAAVAKVVKERQLRAAQRLRLVGHSLQRSIQVRHQPRRRFVGHVPQRGDDRRRSRVQKRARQPDDTVTRDCAETRATRREHDEIGIQLNPVNLTRGQPSVVEQCRTSQMAGQHDWRRCARCRARGTTRADRRCESRHASRSAARCDRRQANAPEALWRSRRRVMSPPTPVRAPRPGESPFACREASGAPCRPPAAVSTVGRPPEDNEDRRHATGMCAVPRARARPPPARSGSRAVR